MKEVCESNPEEPVAEEVGLRQELVHLVALGRVVDLHQTGATLLAELKLNLRLN